MLNHISFLLYLDQYTFSDGVCRDSPNPKSPARPSKEGPVVQPDCEILLVASSHRSLKCCFVTALQPSLLHTTVVTHNCYTVVCNSSTTVVCNSLTLAVTPMGSGCSVSREHASERSHKNPHLILTCSQVPTPAALHRKGLGLG